MARTKEALRESFSRVLIAAREHPRLPAAAAPPRNPRAPVSSSPPPPVLRLGSSPTDLLRGCLISSANPLSVPNGRRHPSHPPTKSYPTFRFPDSRPPAAPRPSTFAFPHSPHGGV